MYLITVSTVLKFKNGSKWGYEPQRVGEVGGGGEKNNKR